ncbi:type II toxin-antitoxin system VapC family toxin [Methyloprofundus sp.]|uniref:type II toxin-antitoxin system VapC family toxin n=1 Tax=Methyloprofundus sp. TaxID=2020875 RepID=UPI003D1338F1
MNYLLDTHTFIWWLNNSPELSATAKKIISRPDNSIFVSHASYWEIAIKVSIGRLTFPLKSLESELQLNGFELLSIKTSHILQSASLPMLHRDPFDRMLIAQAQMEGLNLITVDQHIQQYTLSWSW